MISRREPLMRIIFDERKLLYFSENYWPFQCPINVNNNILPTKPERGTPLKTEHLRMIWLCGLVFKKVYKFDRFKTPFYIEKLRINGEYIIFLISAQKHRLRELVRSARSLETPRQGGSNEYSQHMFWAEIWKISFFWKLSVFGGELCNIFE